MTSVASTQQLAPLPQIWGDVPQRNPNFTGRETLLADLHSALSSRQETAVLPQALHGMGGVGKSQMAIEYVHRHSADYDVVWWVPAEQESQIQASLTRLALRLHLDVGPDPATAVREALSTGASGYRSWLLVFDNAESPKNVQKYLPTGGAGQVLITSRDSDWARITRSVEVDVFTRDESTAFLRKRDPDLSDASAGRLADALGDLPLAIEQAATWQIATGMPVDEYLALLTDKRIELLDDVPSSGYPDSVAAAFELSLEKLQAVNPAARQLLQICSFFAPEPFSRDFFKGSSATITGELDVMLGDSFRLSRAIRDIQRYALARFDHGRNALQIHRLVQTVLIGRMAEDERIRMRLGAHTLLANNMPVSPSRPVDWPAYQALLPHVAASRAVESSDPRVQQLVDGVVRYLYHSGDHVGSQALAEEALKWCRENDGAAAQQTLRMAQWVGHLRWKNGQFAEARTLNLETLDLSRRTYGERDEGTTFARYLVSIDRRTEGDFIGSCDLDEQGMQAARNEFGVDDPVTLILAHSLGVSLRLNGEFARARAVDEDTLGRRETLFGHDDEATLNTRAALLLDLREAGDFVGTAAGFGDLYLRTLAGFGQNAPVTLQAARYLAVSRRKAGDHPGARQLAADTLERYRRRYGEDFPDTLATANNYAIDLRQGGELDASKELATATLHRYESTYGPRHPHTLSTQVNLAIAIRLSGEPEIAYENDLKALTILERSLGADHPYTLTCATNVASDLYALDRHQEAYERDTDTLARAERKLGREHPSTLAVSVNYALDLRSLDRTDEGDTLLSDLLTRLAARLGDQHPATLNALRSIRADCDIDPMPL